MLLPDHDGSIHGGLTDDEMAERVAASATAAPASAATACSGRCARTVGWFMDYRNADGSLSEMCGNGIRVFVRYLVDEGLVDPGLPDRHRHPRRQQDPAAGGRRDHRRPRQAAAPAGDEGLDRRPRPGRPSTSTWATRMRSRSSTTRTTLAALDLTRPPEHDEALYPEGVNVEFVVRRGERHVAMRVHERGSGETRSCGTGAGAVLVATATADAAASARDVPPRRPRRHALAHLDRGRPRAADRARGRRGPGDDLALSPLVIGSAHGLPGSIRRRHRGRVGHRRGLRPSHSPRWARRSSSPT